MCCGRTTTLRSPRAAREGAGSHHDGHHGRVCGTESEPKSKIIYCQYVVRACRRHVWGRPYSLPGLWTTEGAQTTRELTYVSEVVIAVTANMVSTFDGQFEELRPNTPGGRVASTCKRVRIELKVRGRWQNWSARRPCYTGM